MGKNYRKLAYPFGFFRNVDGYSKPTTDFEQEDNFSKYIGKRPSDEKNARANENRPEKNQVESRNGSLQSRKSFCNRRPTKVVKKSFSHLWFRSVLFCILFLVILININYMKINKK